MVSNLNKKQKREFSPERFFLKIGGILFLIIAVVLIFINFQMFKKKQQLAFQIEDYKKQIGELESRSEILKEEIINSDNPDYIEKIAREESDMQKPGEKVVSFVEQNPQQKEAQTQENLWNSNFWFSWIGQSWNWIKGKF
jgi:cell division protein DivIC